MNLYEAKGLAMVILGLGSFLVGMVPCWLYRGMNRDIRGSLLRSVLLCVGAGVLLGTSLLHMLPEAKESLPEYAELSFCGGFFFIYLVDELVHLFYGRGETDESSEASHGHGHSHGDGAEETHRHRNYGAVESASLLVGTQPVAGGCHSVQREPCTESSAGRGGLLLALTTHAILEGLAIGLEVQPSKVLLLMGAVCSHKFVVGFCLGTELASSRTITSCKYTVAILLFAIGSVVGIGIGMAVEQTNEFWSHTVLASMQAIAGGTLLYVTVSEVLPRERARWHGNVRAAGILQFSAVIVGFLLLFALNRYLDFDHNV